MADWTNLSVADDKNQLLTRINNRDIDALTLLSGSFSNLPRNAIRWNRSSNKLQTWTGTAWEDLILSIAGGGTGGGTGANAKRSLNIEESKISLADTETPTRDDFILFGDVSEVGIPNKKTTVSDILGLATAAATSAVKVNDETRATPVRTDEIRFADLSTGSNLNRKNTIASILDLIAVSDIPNLNASKITSGAFSSSRIPNLDASKITSGRLSKSRLPSDTFFGTIPDVVGLTAEEVRDTIASFLRQARVFLSLMTMLMTG